MIKKVNWKYRYQGTKIKISNLFSREDYFLKNKNCKLKHLLIRFFSIGWGAVPPRTAATRQTINNPLGLAGEETTSNCFRDMIFSCLEGAEYLSYSNPKISSWLDFNLGWAYG